MNHFTYRRDEFYAEGCSDREDRKGCRYPFLSLQPRDPRAPFLRIRWRLLADRLTLPAIRAKPIRILALLRLWRSLAEVRISYRVASWRGPSGRRPSGKDRLLPVSARRKKSIVYAVRSGICMINMERKASSGLLRLSARDEKAGARFHQGEP